jgi:malonate-semialdehyde dehydrogenase (acetylating)/methylmalonate-semialdehyde dehydrogenase
LIDAPLPSTDRRIATTESGEYPADMTQIAQPPTDTARADLPVVNHWIGGKRVAGTSGRRGPVYNPATGEVAREVDFASVEEVDAAVKAAHDAFPAWRATSLSRRTEIMFRIRNLVDEHRRTSPPS